MQDAVCDVVGIGQHVPEVTFHEVGKPLPIPSWPPQVLWAPQPDITVHELAMAMRLLIMLGTDGASSQFHEELRAYPPNVRRHFETDGEARHETQRAQLLDAIEDGIAGRVRS